MDPKTKQKLTAVLVVLLGVVFLGVYYYFIRPDSSGEINQSPGPSASTLTPEQSLKYLQGSQTYKLADISKQEDASFEELPPGLKFFMPEDRQSVKTFKVFFDDNTQGYGASFEYSGDVLSAYLDSFYLINTDKGRYKILEGKRTDTASLRVVTDSQYTFRIDMVKRDANLVDVVIIAKPNIMNKN